MFIYIVALMVIAALPIIAVRAHFSLGLHRVLKVQRRADASLHEMIFAHG